MQLLVPLLVVGLAARAAGLVVESGGGRAASLRGGRALALRRADGDAEADCAAKLARMRKVLGSAVAVDLPGNLECSEEVQKLQEAYKASRSLASAEGALRKLEARIADHLRAEHEASGDRDYDEAKRLKNAIGVLRQQAATARQHVAAKRAAAEKAAQAARIALERARRNAADIQATIKKLQSAEREAAACRDYAKAAKVKERLDRLLREAKLPPQRASRPDGAPCGGKRPTETPASLPPPREPPAQPQRPQPMPQSPQPPAEQPPQPPAEQPAAEQLPPPPPPSPPPPPLQPEPSAPEQTPAPRLSPTPPPTPPPPLQPGMSEPPPPQPTPEDAFDSLPTATEEAAKALFAQSWPSLSASPDTTEDAGGVENALLSVLHEGDVWSTTCDSRLAAARRLLVLARRQLAAAEVRTGRVATEETAGRAKRQELFVKAGNLRSRCLSHQKTCMRTSASKAAQRESLAKQQDDAVTVGGVLNPLATPEEQAYRRSEKSAGASIARTLKNVSGTLQGGTEALKRSGDDHSDFCVGRILMMDREVVEVAKRRRTVADKLEVDKVDLELARTWADKVSRGVTDLRKYIKDTESRCADAAAELKKHAEALRARRRALLGEEAALRLTDCEVSDWEATSEGGICTATCGGGTRRLTRKVIRAAGTDGLQCGRLQMDGVSCGEEPCAVDCAFGAWGEWSACAPTCGSLRHRRREVVTATIGAGQTCVGEVSQMEPCPEQGGVGALSSCPTGCERHSALVP